MRFISLTCGALVALALLVPPAASGQVEGLPSAGTDPGTELVDRIAAVVGDSIVLQSQIVQELQRLSLSGQELPTDAEGLRALQQDIAQAFVDQLLLVQAAERDTLVSIPDDRVDEVFEQAWQDQLRTFGSEENLREALGREGMRIDRYRADTRNMIRRNLLVQTYLQNRRRAMEQVAVHEDEVREFFESQRNQLGERPATLTVQHLFFQAQASEEDRAAARERAEAILQMLRDGEEFAALARRFSDDPGSRQQGGELGWFRRGDGLVEEFEDAAFVLRERQISGVVETDYGAHIIQIERVRGPERKIHHILIAAEAGDAGSQEVEERVREIADEVRGGRRLMEFSDRATRVGTLPDSLTMARTELDELPEQYARALRDVREGDVVGPVEIPMEEAGLPVYVVAHVTRTREAGEFTLDDVRDQIRNRLREQKFEERLLRELRARTYIDIRL